jgi:DNA-binding IclR family transcriptional regulator
MTLKFFFEHSDKVFTVSELHLKINAEYGSEYSYLRFHRYVEYLEKQGFLAKVGQFGYQIDRKLCKSAYDYYRSILNSFR